MALRRPPREVDARSSSALPALVFRPGNVATYRGRRQKELVWLLEILPADEPTAEPATVEVSTLEGAPAYQLVASFTLAGVGLQSSSALREELLGLLRATIEDTGWRIRAGRGRPAKPRDEAREYLTTAATAIAETGVWPAGQLPGWLAPGPLLQEQLPIPSVGHYVALQQALARGFFEEVEGTRFPRALLEKGGVRGHAELRQITPEEELSLPPAEAEALAREMWRQRDELSDRDADALDAVSACWLRQARSPLDRVPIYVDDILRLRHLKPKRGGTGRRGGYEPEQRAEIFRSLLRLQDVWLEIAEVTVYEEQPGKTKAKPRQRTLQSRAFVMTDRVGQQRLDGTMDVEALLVTPGTAFGRFLFGPGRQVALLSANALRYDPTRQKPEKRLVRYLSWQWRVAASTGELRRSYRVQTLLEEIGLEASKNDPARLRARLERCLDTLREAEDIAGWQYEAAWEEELASRQGWLQHWLEAKVIIEAPAAIQQAYLRIQSPAAAEKPTLAAPEEDASLPWAEKVAERRKAARLSQSQAAREIGISQPFLSQIEAGQRTPSERIAVLLQRWLEQG